MIYWYQVKAIILNSWSLTLTLTIKVLNNFWRMQTNKCWVFLLKKAKTKIVSEVLFAESLILPLTLYFDDPMRVSRCKTTSCKKQKKYNGGTSAMDANGFLDENIEWKRKYAIMRKVIVMSWNI